MRAFAAIVGYAEYFIGCYISGPHVCLYNDDAYNHVKYATVHGTGLLSTPLSFYSECSATGIARIVRQLLLLPREAYSLYEV
jgi:hypothetical protein